MDKLLLKYLNYYYNDNDNYNLSIKTYNIEGSICFITFYTDIDQYYFENVTINIWDMILFLETQR